MFIRFHNIKNVQSFNSPWKLSVKKYSLLHKEFKLPKDGFFKI